MQELERKPRAEDLAELMGSGDNSRAVGKASVTVLCPPGAELRVHDIQLEEMPLHLRGGLDGEKPLPAPSVSETQPMPAVSDSLLREVMRVSAVALAGRALTTLPEKPFSKKQLRSDFSSTASVVVLKQRFELVNLVGVGGAGTVYKALDRVKAEAGDPNPYVAIKLVNDDLRSSPGAFYCLRQEARNSQKLAHDNITSVYDFDCEDDLFFMVMELMEGVSSDRLLKQQPCGLEVEAARTLLKDVFNAVSYVHKNNIVHADIKPSNIFLTSENKVKLFDFGSACDLSVCSEAKSAATVRRMSNLTPAYASYEMLNGVGPSFADDIYSLACVTYELYTGRHPFGKVPADLAFKRNMKVKAIGGMPRAQMRALARALSFKSECRTQSVQEFYEQFFPESGKYKTGLYCMVASIATFIVTLSIAYFAT